jgi:hypothetical protein
LRNFLPEINDLLMKKVENIIHASFQICTTMVPVFMLKDFQRNHQCIKRDSSKEEIRCEMLVPYSKLDFSAQVDIGFEEQEKLQA